MKNFTSRALPTATPEHDKNDLPQDGGLAEHQLTIGPAPVPKPKPTIAQLRDAMGVFGIHGTCRCIGYELLSFWQPAGTVFPSVATLAKGLGLKPRLVRYHLAHLERVGLWVRHLRSGTTNTYELVLPGGVRQPSAGGSGNPVPGEVTKKVSTTPLPPLRGVKRQRRRFPSTHERDLEIQRLRSERIRAERGEYANHATAGRGSVQCERRRTTWKNTS